MAQINDFVLCGEVESRADEQGFGLTSAKNALLGSYHNPRRALVRQVVLTSDYKRCADFVVRIGGKVLCSKQDLGAEDMAWLKCLDASAALFNPARRSECTDFVVVGAAEVQDDNLPLGGVQRALLGTTGYANPRRALPQPLVLTSDHARCTDFVTSFGGVNGAGYLCSKELTTDDWKWLEAATGAKPGTLFALRAAASREAPSATELPWEPAARYKALARQSREWRRRRGAKDEAHVEALRQSDPLINPRAWLDVRALAEERRRSNLVKLQEQAFIDRAMNDHKVRTKQSRSGRLAYVPSKPAASVKPHAYPAEVRAPSSVKPSRNEAASKEPRNSADSVISFLDDSSPKTGYEPTSPASVLDGFGPACGSKAWSLDKGSEPGSKLSYAEMAKGAGGKIVQKLQAAGAEVDVDGVVWFEGREYVRSTDSTGYSSA